MTYAEAIRTSGLTALAIASRYGVTIREVMEARRERAREVDRAYRAQKMAPILQAKAEAARIEIDAEMVAFTRALSGAAWREMFVTKPFASQNVAERPWNAGAAARNDAAFAARRAHHRTLGGVADYSSQPEAA